MQHLDTGGNLALVQSHLVHLHLVILRAPVHKKIWTVSTFVHSDQHATQLFYTVRSLELFNSVSLLADCQVQPNYVPVLQSCARKFGLLEKLANESMFSSWNLCQTWARQRLLILAVTSHDREGINQVDCLGQRVCGHFYWAYHVQYLLPCFHIDCVRVAKCIHNTHNVRDDIPGSRDLGSRDYD